MISFHIEFSKIELEAILFAYEHSSEDSFHYGAKLIVPDDEAIVRKLNENASGIFYLSENEVNTIFRWINKTIERKYRDAKYASSAEKSALIKVSEITELLGFRDIRKRQANQIAELSKKAEELITDSTISSKNRTEKQVVEQNNQIIAVHIDKKKDNRSIAEKINAAKALKKELTNIDKEYANKCHIDKKKDNRSIAEKINAAKALKKELTNIDKEYANKIHIDKKEDNRSIAEKINAAKALKKELTNIDKEYTNKFNKIKKTLKM
jgi:hypothetical protein